MKKLNVKTIMTLDGYPLHVDRAPTPAEMEMMRNAEPGEGLKASDIEVPANFVTVARQLVRAVQAVDVGEAVEYGRVYERLLAFPSCCEAVEIDDHDYELIMTQLGKQGVRYGINLERVQHAFIFEAEQSE